MRERDSQDRTRGFATACVDLVSFDGGTRARQRVTRPDRYRHLELLGRDEIRIVRGGGYSYAAASFGANAVVQDFRAFDRILGFDAEHGILECEAGATLGKINALAVARGWYLPVQAGYPKITIGGSIAADIHGKNQFRDGTFRRQVDAIRLLHPHHGTLTLNGQENARLFDLTCGGLGLTGHVLSARLRLARLPSRQVTLRRQRIERLEDTLRLLEEQAAGAAFVYTWQNLTVSDDTFGRGFVYVGQFLANGDGPRGRPPGRLRAIDAARRARLGLPLLNRLTTRGFNQVYERVQAMGPAATEVDLFDMLFPIARKAVYYYLFGARGFHEYQVIIPPDAVDTVAAELRRFLRTNPVPISLGSCKLFRGTQSQLRFDGTGLCLTLNFPRDTGGERFARWLDGLLVREAGGLPNIVKDSRLSREIVRHSFPNYDAFRDELSRFDPKRIYRSEVSERLGL